MTIKEVAREAGVSVSTVSKIINNKADSISPATIERVLEIAKKNHYIPYGKIKSTLNPKGFTLGVMLRSVSASPGLLRGIVSRAQEENYGVLVFDSGASAPQEEANFRALSRHQVDGLLWEPVSPI
ncbi:MAG: LacI family DNA-binding transcriptional regulator, partial [Oscillibacter sp.]|nr:LacI family DNA-binding transcriptional regulator [Oscillibacter sp.]